MKQECGPHWREVFKALFESARKENELERRIAELRDLLQLETDAAIKTSEAESRREKIKARDSGEGEE